jgi:hypothetical protein
MLSPNSGHHQITLRIWGPHTFHAAAAAAACIATAAPAVQAGNDFLPNVPSIDIYDKPCGLDLLFSAYKALLPQMGGHITGASKFVYNFRVFSYWAKMLGHTRAAQTAMPVSACACQSSKNNLGRHQGSPVIPSWKAVQLDLLIGWCAAGVRKNRHGAVPQDAVRDIMDWYPSHPAH